MENKKDYTKIIVSIIAVIVLVVGIVVFINNTTTSKINDSITVEVIDINGQLIKEKVIEYNKDDTLVNLIENNFNNVLIENGMLMSIESLTTPEDWSTFICIYINDEMSKYAIDEMTFNNGDKISFIDTKTNN